MKAQETETLNRLPPEEPASGWRIWELETIAAVVVLVWLLGAVQFFHHMA